MYDFNNRKKKKDKKHMNKNRSRKRNRKKGGDSIYKVSNEISKEERKKFCIWNHISNFFLKIII